MRSAAAPIALLCALVACASTKLTPLPAAAPAPQTPQAALHDCDPYQEPDTRVARSEPLPASVADAYQARSGCDCAQATSAPGVENTACGPFPCTPQGCHVGKCRVDEDCRAGMCSHHASWPHGYCVADDPK
ncbi:MAG: hypothetical protein WKG00_07295 [Polyangiaceae bacterium]